MSPANFAEFKNKVIKNISGLEKGSQEVYFECEDGTKYFLYHYQVCSEKVYIEEIAGNINDIIGCKINIADVVTSGNSNIFLQTFFTLSSDKGSLIFRWIGESVGSVLVDVSFNEV